MVQFAHALLIILIYTSNQALVDAVREKQDYLPEEFYYTASDIYLLYINNSLYDVVMYYDNDQDSTFQGINNAWYETLNIRPDNLI